MTSTPSPAEHKQHVTATFNQAASTYDAQWPLRVCAERMVEISALQSGEYVLDVATGTGFAAISACQAVGPRGHVIGIDLAEDMLDQARRKISEAGLSNIEVQLGDAEHLDFPDSSFDVVQCASGIFFLPNQAVALSEWRRVLKPGGRVIFTTFAPTSWRQVTQLFDERLRSYGITTPGPGAPELALAEPEQCNALLYDGGFADITVRTEQHGFYFSSMEDYWATRTYGAVNLRMAQLTPEQRAQFKEEHLAEVAVFVSENGIWRDYPLNFAMGRKP